MSAFPTLPLASSSEPYLPPSCGGCMGWAFPQISTPRKCSRVFGPGSSTLVGDALQLAFSSKSGSAISPVESCAVSTMPKRLPIEAQTFQSGLWPSFLLPWPQSHGSFFVQRHLDSQVMVSIHSHRRPNPSVKGTSRKRAAPYVERWAAST